MPARDPVAQRIQRTDLWRELFDRFGRSEVREVQAQEAVTSYVTKYSVKDLTEWLMW